MAIYSRRSSARCECLLQLRAERDERLLARLCELGRLLDPVPEHVAAAARSAFTDAAVDSGTELQMGERPMSEQSSPNEQQVQKPLTLVLPFKSQQHAQALRDRLEDPQGLRTEIRAALDELHTVHFARFVVLDGEPPRLAVITSYDDDFEDYIMSFTDKLGDVFDAVLEFIADPPPRPVKQHREEFLDYVKANDLGCVGEFYSAYPDKRVVDICPVPIPAG